MKDEALLLQDMFNHTIEECTLMAEVYQLIRLQDQVKNRLKEQVYLEKIKQKNYLMDLYYKVFNARYNYNEEYETKNEESINDCLIEEVEYINELQIIQNNIYDESLLKLINNIISIQHQIIYKLLVIQTL